MILRPRILFIANAGPAVGGGHVMRSLSLARALGEHGAECVFLAPPVVAGILDAFAPDMSREAVASVAAADLPAAVAGLAFDAVVFDHYGLGRADHQFIAQGRPTLVIDDLADRPRDGEFTQCRAFAQLAHVGEYVAQAEGGVDVLGVERRQDDGRRAGVLARSTHGC